MTPVMNDPDDLLYRVLSWTPYGWDWMHPALRLPLCFLSVPVVIPVVLPLIFWMFGRMFWTDMRDDYEAAKRRKVS